MEFVWFILIGLAAGWLARQLMKGGGFGVIGESIVGMIGLARCSAVLFFARSVYPSVVGCSAA